MPAERIVDLLRHGESGGGAKLRGARTDDPLTARGWADLRRATQAATNAGRPPWDTVVTSPLRRCHAFARALASEGPRLVVDERLREYDFGDWDGQPLAALWAAQGAAFGAFLGNPDEQAPPGGEMAAAYRERVRAAWRDLTAPDSDQRILVIGHGGVLRQWLVDALAAPMSAQAGIEWPHATMSRLRIHDDPPHPRSVSLVFHGVEPRD